MTRRQFTGLGLMAGAGGAGAGCASGKQPQLSSAPLPRLSFRAGSAGRRVLVGYATRTGSTLSIAAAIGEDLSARGFAVEVAPMGERPALAGFDAAILGSAINGRAWLPEARSFVESNAVALATMPVALFCVHAMNLGSQPKNVAARKAYLDEVRRRITPVSEAWFAGLGPTAENSTALQRWLFRLSGGGCEGDCRDWQAVHAWATEVLQENPHE